MLATAAGQHARLLFQNKCPIGCELFIWRVNEISIKYKQYDYTPQLLIIILALHATTNLDNYGDSINTINKLSEEVNVSENVHQALALDKHL